MNICLRKITMSVLILAMIMMLASCGSSANPDAETSETGTVQGTTGTTGDTSAAGFEKFKGVTLTYWLPYSSTLIKSLDENVVYQEMGKKTGIKIEFQTPPIGQEKENFQLMVSSKTLPDIIADQTYKGGGLKAIEDGVYIKLNDYLESYAPNYLSAMNTTPEINRQSKEDDGTVWSFRCIQLEKEPAYIGPAIRQDYLDKVGLDMPKTVDDWYNVLKAFRDELKLESPCLFTIDPNISGAFEFSGVLSGTFGAATTFLNKNGTVVYGPTEPGFKEFLTLMNKWYKEGLLDKDFVTRDSKSTDAQITSGKAGAVFTSLYGSFSTWQSAGVQTNPDFQIVAAPYPVIKEGDDPSETLHIRLTNNYVRTADRAISTSCKNIEAAMRWLDYGYTDEGFMLYNYGIEGLTYEWVDGGVEAKDWPTFFPASMADKIKSQHPQWTDLMINNPDKIDFWTLIDKYKVHYTSSLRNPMSYLFEENVYKAMEVWSEPGDDYVIPTIITFTNTESQTKADILNQIDTYRREAAMNFIVGEKSLDEFDDYVAQIKALGIDQVIQIYEDALERYNNR